MHSCFPSSDVCLLDGLFMAEPPPATAKGIILQKLHLDVEHVSSWRLLTNRKTCNRNINSRLYCFRKKCTEFRASLMWIVGSPLDYLCFYLDFQFSRASKCATVAQGTNNDRCMFTGYHLLQSASQAHAFTVTLISPLSHACFKRLVNFSVCTTCKVHTLLYSGAHVLSDTKQKPVGCEQYATQSPQLVRAWAHGTSHIATCYPQPPMQVSILGFQIHLHLIQSVHIWL